MTHTHTHTHTRARARARARTHIHTHIERSFDLRVFLEGFWKAIISFLLLLNN